MLPTSRDLGQARLNKRLARDANQMPTAVTAASAFVWAHVRHALQQVAAIGACSA